MPEAADRLGALRLRRRELEARIEELESGSARAEELGPDGFRDVTRTTLVELHRELGAVGASIHRALAALRNRSAAQASRRAEPATGRNRRAAPREWLAKINIQEDE